jgi:hypothetical protein
MFKQAHKPDGLKTGTAPDQPKTNQGDDHHELPHIT